MGIVRHSSSEFFSKCGVFIWVWGNVFARVEQLRPILCDFGDVGITSDAFGIVIHIEKVVYAELRNYTMNTYVQIRKFRFQHFQTFVSFTEFLKVSWNVAYLVVFLLQSVERQVDNQRRTVASLKYAFSCVFNHFWQERICRDIDYARLTALAKRLAYLRKILP